MLTTVQKTPDNKFVALYDENNKLVRYEDLPKSGSTVIAETKLRVWAKRNGMDVR